MDDAQLAQFCRRLFLDLVQLEQDRGAFHKRALLSDFLWAPPSRHREIQKALRWTRIYSKFITDFG